MSWLHRGTRIAAHTLWDAWTNQIAAAPVVPRPLRLRMLRMAGIGLENVAVSPGVFFGGRSVHVSDGCFINRDVFFDASAPIEIGRNVDLGMRVLLITSTHDVGSSNRRAGRQNPKPLVIGDGCWIGANSVILPGVCIGPGSIIAAGSVVTADCAPNSLYAGIPAKQIRALELEPTVETPGDLF